MKKSLRKQAGPALQLSEEIYKLTIDNIGDALHVSDKHFTILLINKKLLDWHRRLGLPKDVIGRNILSVYPFLHETVLKEYKSVFETGQGINTEEMHTINGIEMITETYKIPISEEGKTTKIITIIRDVTERKKAEQELQQRENDLAQQARNLEELNTALKVLLKKREEDKTELEEKVLLNIKELVLPYLDKIRKSGLDESQHAYADILESHLREIVSSFSYRLSSAFLNLTPAEINVANLVRQGKTNKEIADLLNVSSRTAAFHRERIRKKLGITNQKTNLKSFLSSIN
jgi:PAS domain S-box-containing protein